MYIKKKYAIVIVVVIGGDRVHKYLRAIGLGNYNKKKDVEALLKTLEETATVRSVIQIDRDTTECEICGEVAPGIGIAMVGELDAQDNFQREYYYPYLISPDLSSNVECSVQRHGEKETYAGLVDDNRVGISLIFYLINGMEYRKQKVEHKFKKIQSVNLAGLSISGKVLLPLKKTRKQVEMSRNAFHDRNNLIEAAKNGDEEAIETLTVEDMDMYTQISKRIMKEDIYSIIDSCFMPFGIECDQYSILGEIMKVEEKVNSITKEVVYDLTLECNDMIFHIGITKKDLLGEPKIGRRFKGQIWMQGNVIYQN